MKINLEYPYSQDWKFGYLQVNGEGRKTVILFNSGKVRSSTSYARYLMAVHIGRYLTEEEEVDHIDCNKFDDSLSNLQILTKEAHREKTNKEQSAPLLSFTCKCCGRYFERSKQRTTSRTKYCSLECSHKMVKAYLRKWSEVAVNDLLLENIDQIKSLVLEGKNDKSIADIFDVHKATIYNFRKKNGILGPREVTNEKLKEHRNTIISLYNSGLGYSTVGAHVGLSRKVIARFIRDIKNEGKEMIRQSRSED